MTLIPTPLSIWKECLIQYRKGEIRTKDIIPTEKACLGKGVYGSVHQSTNHSSWIVKKVNNPNLCKGFMHDVWLENILEEFTLGHSLTHSNIMGLHQLFLKFSSDNACVKAKFVGDLIHGKTITDIAGLSKEERSEFMKGLNVEDLLKQVYNVSLYLFDQKIKWNDLHKRNILITDSKDGQGVPQQRRIMFFDFDRWRRIEDLDNRYWSIIEGTNRISRNLHSVFPDSFPKNPEILIAPPGKPGKCWNFEEPRQHLNEKEEKACLETVLRWRRFAWENQNILDESHSFFPECQAFIVKRASEYQDSLKEP
jgi:hypothetical protein